MEYVYFCLSLFPPLALIQNPVDQDSEDARSSLLFFVAFCVTSALHRRTEMMASTIEKSLVCVCVCVVLQLLVSEQFITNALFKV